MLKIWPFHRHQWRAVEAGQYGYNGRLQETRVLFTCSCKKHKTVTIDGAWDLHSLLNRLNK